MLIKPFLDAWKRPFDFKGKTKLNDFWNYALIAFLINRAFAILAGFFEIFGTYDERGLLVFNNGGGPILEVLWNTFAFIGFCISLGALPVTLSVIVRRLRDVGKHWLWILVPFWWIYLCTKPSKEQITSIEEG